ncbi:MAG: alpha/beta fold hydrolase [Gammaproteobacteria bacterium]|nr:alpha/beta fold hydrolase [Gammaproteobacteria bacterium]
MAAAQRGLKTRTILCACVLLLGTGFAAQALAQRFADLDDCVLKIPGGMLSAQARCGTLKVPEDPARPDGRQIELAYAVVPAPTGQPRPDPVFYLAGGPGQSARDVLPLMRHALRDVNQVRDLIFLDQRGTGASHPLRCDFSAVDPFLEPDPEVFEALYRECLDNLDADVRHYLSADAARDLDALREHLGYGRINLVGTSYGTRLAQVYLRAYPDRVRSLILDGVVPTRLVLGSEHGRALDDALARILARCSDDPVCAERFPDLPEKLADLASRFDRDSSQRLTLVHPRTGREQVMDLNRDGLAQTLRMLAYAPQSQALLPLLIDEAAASDIPERIASQLMQIYEQLDAAISVGLEAAIGCSEDWPRWQAMDATEEADTLLGPAMREGREMVCGIWPRGEVPDDFHTPFQSEVPVLLMSGELDPVTPPRYGEEAAAQYPNHRHLIGAGQGHGILGPRCTGALAARFMEDLDVEALDTSCMDRLGPSPFFVDLLGPSP